MSIHGVHDFVCVNVADLFMYQGILQGLKMQRAEGLENALGEGVGVENATGFFLQRLAIEVVETPNPIADISTGPTRAEITYQSPVRPSFKLISWLHASRNAIL